MVDQIFRTGDGGNAYDSGRAGDGGDMHFGPETTQNVYGITTEQLISIIEKSGLDKSEKEDWVTKLRGGLEIGKVLVEIALFYLTLTK